MHNQSFLYFPLIVAVLFIPGCNTHVGNPINPLSGNSAQQKDDQKRSKTESKTEAIVVHFVEQSTEAPSPFSEGSFVDEQHAWVAGSHLKHTVDGGRTWVEMRPSSEDESVFGKVGLVYLRPYFITPGRGWLKAATGTWQTEDAGLKWRLVFPDGSDVPQFADSQHGWMNAAVGETSEQSYTTQDGGNTWQACGRTRNYTEQHLGGRASFLTPQLAWGITSRTIDRQTIYGVARTTDGGCNWKQLWTSNENPDEWYSDIYFLDEREGWLAGKANGSLYHTRDGGKTWADLPLPTERTKITDVYFASSTVGWIIAKGIGGDTEGMFYTVNGGKTWHQMTRSEIVSGNDLPAEWKAGRLLRLLYAKQQSG